MPACPTLCSLELSARLDRAPPWHIKEDNFGWALFSSLYPNVYSSTPRMHPSWSLRSFPVQGQITGTVLRQLPPCPQPHCDTVGIPPRPIAFPETLSESLWFSYCMGPQGKCGRRTASGNPEVALLLKRQGPGLKEIRVLNSWTLAAL